MLKPIVFASSLLLGGAATAFAISVQRDRTTLTSLPPPSLERTTEALVHVRSALPAPAVEPALAMQEVVIHGRVRATSAAAPPPKPVEFELGPCSEWRDLGPKALADSMTTDQHRVRALCVSR